MTDEATKFLGVAEEFVAERIRQINELGYTPEHDDKHRLEELLTFSKQYTNNVLWSEENLPGRRQKLVKAGAVLIAAITKMDREKKA